ncbi:hypothetical protein [Mediterraneibacter gnavus]|uniref:hypothetical protein n=1 Tax=Mediterraneibacter gnavus TaxID=33038 RepID=UPI0022DFBBD8|nr:hypothetical protein [Mediterraneibacter gnavus]
MGLAFLLVLLGLGCLFLAYREQEPFQEIKVKGEALQKLVVQETDCSASIRKSWDGCMYPRLG